MRNVFSFGDDQGWRIRVRCISIKDRSQFQLSNILLLGVSVGPCHPFF